MSEDELPEVQEADPDTEDDAGSSPYDDETEQKQDEEVN